MGKCWLTIKSKMFSIRQWCEQWYCKTSTLQFPFYRQLSISTNNYWTTPPPALSGQRQWSFSTTSNNKPLWWLTGWQAGWWLVKSLSDMCATTMWLLLLPEESSYYSQGRGRQRVRHNARRPRLAEDSWFYCFSSAQWTSNFKRLNVPAGKFPHKKFNQI